jgi:antitoxin component YwqK of YwqJK toxin-antitoxin module
MAEGKVVHYYPNGRVLEVMNYINDKLEGKYVKFYENGKPMVVTRYHNGMKEGISTYWYENGDIQSETSYYKDKKNGRQKLWGNSMNAGHLITRYFLNDREVGIADWEDSPEYYSLITALAETPSAAASTTVIEEKSARPVITYYPNGNKKEEVKTADGLVETKTWHENGNPEEHLFANKHGRQGEYKMWHENGKLYIHNFYLNGKLEGEYAERYYSGNLMEKAIFHNGKRDGEYRLWYDYDTEKPRVHGFYHDGKLEGLFKHWYENGQVSQELSYHNNKLDGEVKTWDENGTLLVHEYYRAGKLIKIINPISKCLEKNDLIGDPLNANTVIIFSPFRKNAESECYSYDDWEGLIKAENNKHVFIWERTPAEVARDAIGRPLKYAPVFKLPYSGVWVQSTYNLLTRFNTFILKSIGEQLIGSSFGMSSLHGASEHVYIVIPINRSEAMRVPDIKDIDETVFVPQEEDYIDNNEYKPDTIVQIARGGTFSEINRYTGELYRYYLQQPGSYR